MANILKILFLGLMLGGCGLYLTGCKDNRSPEKDSNPAPSVAAPPPAAKVPQLTCDSTVQVEREGQWIALVEKLLNQADQVFSEVWKTSFSHDQSAPTSVFRQARLHLVNTFELRQGLPVKKNLQSTRCRGSRVMPVMSLNQDCRISQIEWQVLDCNGVKIDWYVKVKSLTEDLMGGKLELQFNTALMSEAIGRRLQILATERQTQCLLSYLVNGRLAGLSCRYLGQDESAKNSIEFDKFEYNLDGKASLFSGKATRYEDLVNEDSRASKIQIEIPLEGKIKVTEFATPNEEPKPLLQDPVENNEKPVQAAPLAEVKIEQVSQKRVKHGQEQGRNDQEEGKSDQESDSSESIELH